MANFENHVSGLDSPARDAAAITPSDATDLPRPCRSIYVGSAGNLQVTMVSGATVTLTGLLAGVVYPLRVQRVWATSTTAANLVALQ